MISIITAVRNQLSMNCLFYEYLLRYTTVPYELIVIDNASDDGSREFFEGCEGVKVIRNSGNYSYPYCQNQGIREARYGLYAFFNNDILLSKGWGERVLEFVRRHPERQVFSVASNERLHSLQETKKYSRRWKRIKYPLRTLMGNRRISLRLMHHLMYGNWEDWTEHRFERFGFQSRYGYSGSAILASRQGIEKVGMWDERMQEADYDIALRTEDRYRRVGDIEPVQMILGVYVHHYSRLTLRSRDFVPFADQHNLITKEEKWGLERIQEHDRAVAIGRV